MKLALLIAPSVLIAGGIAGVAVHNNSTSQSAGQPVAASAPAPRISQCPLARPNESKQTSPRVRTWQVDLVLDASLPTDASGQAACARQRANGGTDAGKTSPTPYRVEKSQRPV